MVVMIATTCVAVLGYTQLSKQADTLVSIVHELGSNNDISSDPGVKNDSIDHGKSHGR